MIGLWFFVKNLDGFFIELFKGFDNSGTSERLNGGAVIKVRKNHTVEVGFSRLRSNEGSDLFQVLNTELYCIGHLFDVFFKREIGVQYHPKVLEMWNQYLPGKHWIYSTWLVAW